VEEPPQELDEARIVKLAFVSAEVEQVRVTQTPAAALAIARHADEDGAFLLYLDESANVVTDTWHASLEDALDQASSEYEGLCWRDVTEV
jgi:hypothetical protein